MYFIIIFLIVFMFYLAILSLKRHFNYIKFRLKTNRTPAVSTQEAYFMLVTEIYLNMAVRNILLTKHHDSIHRVRGMKVTLKHSP